MGTHGVIVRVSEEEVGWLRGLTPDEARPAWEVWLADEARAFELEDAHAGVHYLLTGPDGQGPLSFLGNDGYGEVVAFGAARSRLLRPEDVTAVAHAIESIAARTVRARLDSPALAALEPFYERPLEDDHKEWLLAVLQGLMLFVRRAAEDGVALLVAR